MIRTRSSRVGIVWLLLVAAMLLRAGVPTGWMPMVDESGFRIMLCDGSGPVELAPPAAEVTAHPRHHAGHAQDDSVPTAKDEHGSGHDDTMRDLCPFGLALAQALDVPDAVISTLPPQPVAAAPAVMPVAARLVAWRSVRPPARGPPQPA